MILLVFFTTYAFSLDPFFGAEFSFTNKELIEGGRREGTNVINSPENMDVHQEWGKFMIRECKRRGDCQVKMVADKYNFGVYKVIYDDGFWFQISLDPFVIEVQMKPLTVTEIEGQKERIQKDIFDTANDFGLYAHEHEGGGHIHMDVKSSIGDDSILFRNLLVDFNNYFGLGLGGFGKYPYNAPPIVLLQKDQREAFTKLVNIDFFDLSVNEIAEKMRKIVYRKSYSDWQPSDKYQYINLNRFTKEPDEKTIEFRGFYPQKSAEHFIEQVKFLKARINFLKNFKGLVKSNIQEITVLPIRTSHSEEEKQVVIDHLYSSLKQVGLDFNKYKMRLMPALQSYDPVEIPCNREHDPAPLFNLLRSLI